MEEKNLLQECTQTAMINREVKLGRLRKREK